MVDDVQDLRDALEAMDAIGNPVAEMAQAWLKSQGAQAPGSPGPLLDHRRHEPGNKLVLPQ